MRTDVVVVGLGAMGSMTAWQLAVRGASVVGVEQFGIAHDRGSSHGGSRIFRKLLFEGPDYVPLAAASHELWLRLEKETGTRLLLTTGGLNVGTADGELIADSIRGAQAGGVEYELLDGDELRARFPQHALLDDDVAVYDPSAGVLRPEAAIRAAVDAAEQAGAQILAHCRVRELAPRGKGIDVVTDRGRITARKVVLATGAWFADLIGDLALPIRAQRTLQAWFKGEVHGEFLPDRFPVFVRKSRHLGGWGIPDVDGHGVKVGIQRPDAPSKPFLDRPEENWVAPTAADLADVEAFCREAFPGLRSTPVDAGPCMNSKTPDFDFVIGTPKAMPRVVLLGGFSGHGFKHATGVGKVAADLTLDDGTAIPIERFSPDRFAGPAVSAC